MNSSNLSGAARHVPVLPDEILALLAPRPGEVARDERQTLVDAGA